MQETLKEHGKHGPRVAFTDNPSRDNNFLMENFESLRKSQEELDQIAARLNASSPLSNTADTTPPAPTDDYDDDVRDDNDVAKHPENDEVNNVAQHPEKGSVLATQTDVDNDDIMTF